MADKLKVDPGVIRKMGENGELGPDAIRLLFQALAEQAKGAQKNAMNSWTGMTSQMGDVWEQFARDVMSKGPFDNLKRSLRGFLDYAGAAQSNGQQDRLATVTAGYINQAFTWAADGVNALQDALSRVRRTLKELRDAGYGRAMDNIAQGAKTAAKYLLYMYLATRALRLAKNLGLGALRLGAVPLRYAVATVGAVTSPFRRTRGAPGAPGAPLSRGARFMNFLSGVNPAAVQPVLVTNWPAGQQVTAQGGGDTATGGGKKRRTSKTRKGPGKGRSVPAVVSAGEALADSAGKKGFFGRMTSRLGGWLGKVPGASRFGGMLSAAGAGARSWLGKGGRLLRAGGGPFSAALVAAPVLLDEQATTRDKGAAVGSGIGLVAGGMLGSLAGPVGTVIGSSVGSYLGEYLGGWLTDAWQKVSGDNNNGNAGGEAVQKASARVELVAPEGWSARSIDTDDSDPFGLNVNFYNGGNYVPY